MSILPAGATLRVFPLFLLAAAVLVLAACGQRPASVPQVQGQAPVAAEPAKPSAGERFGVLSARAEQYQGQLALALEFPQQLTGSQDFDNLLGVTGSNGEAVSGSWALDENGKTLRFPYVQANASYT
ncbi:MAG: hypothetical protein WAU20_07945, partial [Dokdonella sp.]